MNEPSQKNAETVAGSNSFLGMLCCFCLCATIAFVAYRLTLNAQPARRLWTPDLVETNGNLLIMGESRQLEFWTPSAKTKDYLHKENGQVVPTEQWEAISNDDPVEQFGMMLHTNSSILGFRRVEVWGQGQTTYKPGWWWTVNVFTNYTAADLGKAYDKFWQSHQILFVEVIDNRGSDQK
jgi:hypothetical protein